MNKLSTVQYDESDGVATLWLSRDRVNVTMVRDLTAVCDHLEDDSAARVVVIRGRDGRFCRGIDFEDFDPNTPLDIHGFNKWEKLCARIERLPKVTIAAMEGDVIGAGLQLALLCDARLATADARFQLPEVHLGFLPGMATFRLAKYVGLGHAKRLIMQCPTFDADEALNLGILDGVADDLESAISQIIDAFGPIHTVAVQLSRRLLNESFATDFEDALGHFLAAQHRSISQTAFLETLEKHKK